MISILIVSDRSLEPGADAMLARADVELLSARTADEAIEKLGRNRRIDAVLLCSADAAANRATAEAILDDNPASPPLFASVPPPAPRGIRNLPGRSIPDLIELVLEILERPTGAGPPATPP